MSVSAETAITASWGHKVGGVHLLVRGCKSGYEAFKSVMSVRGRKPMLPVAGTPVNIPSLAEINLNLNENVLRGTRTQHRSQQSVGGRVVLSDSDSDEYEEDEESDKNGENASQMSDDTARDETPDNQEGPREKDDPQDAVGMDLDDDADAQKRSSKKRKAEELAEMGEKAKEVKGAKALLRIVQEAFDAYQEAFTAYIDEYEDLSVEQIEEKQQELAQLGDDLAMAEHRVSESETPFARMQREAAVILENELRGFDTQRRGFGVLKAAIENRVKAELKKKYNKDPSKEDELDEKIKTALDLERVRREKWLASTQSDKTALEDATQKQEQEQSQKIDKEALQTILDERVKEALEEYPLAAHGSGVVRTAIQKRVKAQWALEFRPLTDYKDEDGKRYEDYKARLEELIQRENEVKQKFATTQKNRAEAAAMEERKAEVQKQKLVNAEQRNAHAIVLSAETKLKNAQEKMSSLEANIATLTNELELARAKYEEAYLSPEERKEAEKERSLEPCKEDEEAIYKLRWVLSNAMNEFSQMVDAFQGKRDGDETRHAEEDCYTKLYGEEGGDGTIAPKPIPKWMKEIQVILKTAKDAIEAAEKNDPVGWEVEENKEGKGNEEEVENLYTQYKEEFDDPDGDQKAEEKDLEELKTKMIDADTKLVAMTVVVKNNKLTDDEKMQLIKLDAFQRLPNRKMLAWPQDIDKSFLQKIDKRMSNIAEYIKTQLMQESKLPQVENIDWGSVRVYLQAIQKKKEHPNATEGSANYGINELRDVTLENVATVKYTVEFEMNDSVGDSWEKEALEILKYLSDNSAPYVGFDGQLIITDITGDQPFTEEQKKLMNAQRDKNKNSAGYDAAVNTTIL